MGDTHSELISVSAFNRKFKDTLRDYYTYGFKEKKEYGKDTTFNEDWTRNPVVHGHEEYITDIEKQEIDINCKEILESINKVSADKQGIILSEEELVAKSAT